MKLGREILDRCVLTLRSAPEALRLAQSIGLCPGANATFSRFFDGGVGRLVVVGGTARDPGAARAAPGSRLAGMAGGGINWVSVRTLGSEFGRAAGCCTRCALLRLGKAGGESSSSPRSCSVSVSEPSSLSSGWGDSRVTIGTIESLDCVTVVADD